MARLTAISGCGAKGPACFLVESDEARLMGKSLPLCGRTEICGINVTTGRNAHVWRTAFAPANVVLETPVAL
jgi:hypothetical protein